MRQAHYNVSTSNKVGYHGLEITVKCFAFTLCSNQNSKQQTVCDEVIRGAILNWPL